MTLDAARLEVMQASRILSARGILDAFGHVSRRSPERPEHFLMSRSMAPALVQLEDVLELDIDGKPVSQPDARVFLERFIHAEIYRARPDVGAIVHSHCPAVLPFTVVPTVPLRPVCHICGFLAGLEKPFDVSRAAGEDTNLLISNPALGRSFAAHLGRGYVALMRGHGYTAIGETVAQAVFRAVYTAVNSQILQAALALGDPIYLTDGEAQACETTTIGQMDRAWALWLHELKSSKYEAGEQAQ